MIRSLSMALLALAVGLGAALPAAAQVELEANEIALSSTPRGGQPLPERASMIADFRRPEVTPNLEDNFIVIADLRLPTLGDLSKERWNQVHRRYDSGRGRREKLRT